MTIDQRRERARDWLEAIYFDVQDLILDDHIFWELQEVVKANPRLSKARSHFKHWMMAAHVESVSIGVRRQVKRDQDSISLRRFLEEVMLYPDIVSREFHVRLCMDRSSHLPTEFHERTFDRLVAPGRTEVDPATVENEIAELRAAAKRIEHHADRRFAHYDQRGVAEHPTFKEIGDSLAVCEQLIRRYKVLLDGVSINSLLPTFQYDWKEIFTYPWIERPKEN